MHQKTLTFRTIRTHLELEESESFAEFDFGKRGIRTLKEVLQIPDRITCSQRSFCGGLDDLCMLLKRLSYPCRYRNMIQRFPKPVPILSMITNQTIAYVQDVHENRALNCNRELLSPVNLSTYVGTVTARRAPLPNCFGFIDGTVRPISRPREHQQLLYNSHKRVHALNF